MKYWQHVLNDYDATKKENEILGKCKSILSMVSLANELNEIFRREPFWVTVENSTIDLVLRLISYLDFLELIMGVYTADFCVFNYLMRL